MRHALIFAIAAALALPALAKSTRTPIEARWKAWEQHQQLERESPYAGLKWRSIGPTVQGGRIVDVEVSPADPYTFYVAYASGGIWKTSNNGVGFTPLSDSLPTMVSGDLAIDPQRPDTIWLGSGEPNSSRSTYSGLGLFVSHDGGASFAPAGLDDADRIARVRVDPKDGQRVFVAVQGPLYTPGGMRGIYRTVDGGKSWQQVLAGGEWAGGIDLVFDPRDSRTVYAALWERSRRPWEFVESGEGSGVWKSTDGGDSWTRLPGFPQGEHIGRIGLAISPAKPDRLYASIDNQEPLPEDLVDLGDSPLSPARLKRMSKEEFLRQDPDAIEALVRFSDFEPSLDGKQLTAMVKSGELTMDQLRAELSDGNAALFDTDIRGLDIWRSDDAGGSWTRTNREPIRDFTYTYGYYFGEIRVAPDNADRVYVLGVPTAVSEDGGATWNGSINASQVHADHHAFEFDPANPRRILNGNDGGLDISYDGGATWLKLDRQAVGQSYAVAVDMAEPYNVYTGLQDNGTWKGSSRIDLSAPGGYWDDGSDGWSFLNGGDGMQIQVDPRDASVVYTGYQFGFYHRGGKDGGEVRPRAPLADPALRWNWNTPILLSGHNPDVLYMGANKLYRSLDQGRNWTAVSGDLTRSKARGNVPFATITTLAESGKTFGLLAAGTDDGLLWVTEDGGQEWREITRGLPKERWVSRVVLSSHARPRMYASLNGYRDDNMTPYVYASEDLGRSWASITANLPAEPVNVIAEDPVNPDVLYVGSDRGVYVSSDRGRSWQALQTGLPNVPVHDLVVHPRERELVAGTHGRSVWIVDVLPIQDLTSAVRAKAVHLFHVAAVDAERGWRSAPSRWMAHHEQPPKSTFHYWAAQAGPGKLTVKDADGNPVRVIDVVAVRGINRIDYDLKADLPLGLAAEAARNAKAADQAGGKVDGDGALGKTPLAEARRLGHPPYLTPGEYTLTLELGGASAEGKLTVNPPKAFEPRIKPKYKLRGK
ncbi:MAG: glycosyl hydrolase [Xanthomonadales bacterium]|nr:hypothetical protein [Xanthomonadales bacterium]MCC6592738.1 glycosyl hydrolase [Xanthomonadales bacterium]MCE7932558.1 glycosyl hydrolase [Xanthomonadales bacterium PRO6]